MSGLKIAFTGLPRQYNNLREEILDVTDTVLLSGNLMSGNYTAEFESWLAQKNQSNHAITCHSGTQALEIIARYYADPHETARRVLIPAMTYPATANAFITAGWTVDIADVDYRGIMDSEKVPYPNNYDAVCLVGLYGASINRDEKFWNKHFWIVIEDGAQHWLSNNCQRFGNATAISFDPTKNLPNYGNGGAIVTDDHELFDFARDYTNNGKASKHAIAGSNSRMSEIDCAQMMIKTRYIDEWQLRRKNIAAHWLRRLEDDARVRCLINYTNFDKHSFHKFVIEVDQRDIVQRNLSLRKIETKIHYAEPLQELPVFQQYQGPDMLSASYALSRRCLSLPIYPELTDLEVEYIIDQLLDCVA
jgi:dTDP-4-amino-4,6-dideoxygalactose transaminase